MRALLAIFLPVLTIAGCRPEVETPASPAQLRASPESSPTARSLPPTLQPTVPSRALSPTIRSLPPTPQPTSPLVGTLTPLPAALPVGLTSELFFHFGAGRQATYCWRPFGEELPRVEVRTSPPNLIPRNGLCLFGFQLGDLVRIEVYDPQGQMRGEDEYRVPDHTFFAQRSWIRVPLMLPLSLSHGEWGLKAISEGQTVEGNFFVGSINTDQALEEPFITHSHVSADLQPNPLDVRWMAPYAPGETMRIQGVFFEPEIEVSIGIYGPDIPMKLHSFLGTFTDSEGAFSVDLDLDDTFLTGGYVIAPAPEIENSGVGEFAGVAKFEVQPDGPWPACEGAPLSSLRVGSLARVSGPAPLDLIGVDYGPGGRGPAIVGSLQPGEILEIHYGPACRDGTIYWEIHSLDSGLTGRVPEEGGDQAGIAPLP